MSERGEMCVGGCVCLSVCCERGVTWACARRLRALLCCAESLASAASAAPSFSRAPDVSPVAHRASDEARKGGSGREKSREGGREGESRAVSVQPLTTLTRKHQQELALAT
eukprot:1090329-Rhodomonas_salina.1